MSISDIAAGVGGGLTDFFASLGGSLEDFIISLLTTAINFFLFPINALIDFFIPDLSTLIVNFKNTYSYIFTDLITYIYSYIPPMSKNVILTYLTVMISFYTIYFTYKGIILIPKLIQKIKFW